MSVLRLAFLAADSPPEVAVRQSLAAQYPMTSPQLADVLVVIGGNAHVVRAAHRWRHLRRPFFGLSLGYKGFLTNEFDRQDLPTRVEFARPASLAPLEVRWSATDGRRGHALAFNEVALFRETPRMMRVSIAVEDRLRMTELTADGILVATPAGSAAYNLSAHGPILPVGARLVALTPIAPFRPRRWRGALLPDRSVIRIRVLEPAARLTSVTADFLEIASIAEATIRLREDDEITLLLDAGHSLNDRVLEEQFKS